MIEGSIGKGESKAGFGSSSPLLLLLMIFFPPFFFLSFSSPLFSPRRRSRTQIITEREGRGRQRVFLLLPPPSYMPLSSPSFPLEGVSTSIDQNRRPRLFLSFFLLFFPHPGPLPSTLAGTGRTTSKEYLFSATPPPSLPCGSSRPVIMGPLPFFPPCPPLSF